MRKTKRETKDAVVLEYALVMFDLGGECVQEIWMDYGEYSSLTLHACLRETTAEPATDDTAADWMETPDLEYLLGVWFEGSDELTRTSLTRAQYIQLKECLASMRAVERAA